PEAEPAAKEKTVIEETAAIPGESILSLAAHPESAPCEEAAPQRPMPLAAPQRPMPLAAPAAPQVEIEAGEIVATIGPRTYRVLGLEKCTGRGQMRVNVKV